MKLTARRRYPQRGGTLLWLLVLLLLGLLLLLVYFLRAPLLRGVAEWWIVDEPLEKAQALVVLGGDNPMADRVRHAVALYRADWAPRVVLSGTRLRGYLSEADLMKRDATSLGMPAEDLILARHDAHSTLGEALALRPVLAEHNFRKIIVVTSNFHSRRTRKIFRAVYRAQGTQVWVSAAPDSNFDPARWWRQREGWELLFLELLKTLYTWWEVRERPPPSAAWFASPLEVRYSR